MKFRLKNFTKWDETDSIKQMKDSDILAEPKKNNSSINYRVAKHGLLGAATGGLVGALKGNAKTGAILGGLGGLALGNLKTSKEKEENKFYNDRLRYAKTMALRREKKDWKLNQTGREGYTY